MPTSLKQMGEFDFIKHLRKNAAVTNDVVLGIGDDAAVIKSSGNDLELLATDMLVANIHFNKKDLPQAIGRKALACNISDIAAMGGWPKAAVVSIGVPAGTAVKFLKAIFDGMNKCAKEYKVALVGGDTVRAKELVINVALTGRVAKRNLISRSGAEVGDQIFVTGPLGGSLKSGRHLSFKPRVIEAQFLCRNYKPHAMIDISDGLVADLQHILDESRVGAVLYEEKIPLNHKATLQGALYDGEDFELICTLSKTKAEQLLKDADKKKYDFACIGEIVAEGKGLHMATRKGNRQKLNVKGYRHF
ncbi:MAG: thiamine-phosphate kinase [Candidatus Omnitrophica bacterium]|nr:thiamine-phosphate kinase [Candidatus Omnitrophota bacterium]